MPRQQLEGIESQGSLKRTLLFEASILASDYVSNLRALEKRERFMNAQQDVPKAFQTVIDHVITYPMAKESKVLAKLIESLVDSTEFDLNKINGLHNAKLRQMCFAVFNHCMSEGLSEEQRLLISKTIEPYASLANTETRH